MFLVIKNIPNNYTQAQILNYKKLDSTEGKLK